MNIYGVLLIAGRPTGEFQGSFQMFSSFFIGISLVLLAIGVILYSQRRYWISHSNITIGKITEVSKRYSRDDHMGKFPTYFPIVSYLVNGHEFKKEADKGFTADNIVGKEVPVRYLNDNPNESTLTVDAAPTMNPLLFFVLGGLLFLSSLFLILVINK
ncbi:MAG: hypothetical protein RJA76_1977 [Bacteroidota bacterium]|jgi:hypothetical protein